MSKYASNTSVPVSKTVGEIQSALIKYGAGSFAYMSDEKSAAIAFEMQDRRIRLRLILPNRSDKKFWYTVGRHVKRNEQQAFEAWEQECRSAWRALLLCIKAKLEAVHSKIETFDEAFLPHIILPSGRTFSEEYVPQIAAIYSTGEVPKLMAVN